MRNESPILLSFYSLTNGKTTLTTGQLAYSLTNDLSFMQFTWRKTFRTLVDLYRVRSLADRPIELIFNEGSIHVTTDKNGAFMAITDHVVNQNMLQRARTTSGEQIVVIDRLYPVNVHLIDSPTIVVSDIDDTLLHSYIRNKIKKFRTLMFTRMEKRKAVKDMMHLMNTLATKGAYTFYLSNSEQNLYPLIFRFLQHNKFPLGPLFLKPLRRLHDVVFKPKGLDRSVHKVNMLKMLMDIFYDKKFILIGDNTQRDLYIYVQAAKVSPERVQAIVIRKVFENTSDKIILDEAMKIFKRHQIKVYYNDALPSDIY